MFFNKSKSESELSRPEVDYANDLYRMFHNRELEPSEITKENVQKIITEYSNKLCKIMQMFK
jgi:division protein CdvB (Snf7/Vps24/ESCRT-III family)